MKLETLIKAKRAAVLDIAVRHGARNIRVFGSVARGESGPKSDIDFLVDLDKERSLPDLGALWVDLEDLLGCRVDVVTADGLHWYIRDRILREARTL